MLLPAIEDPRILDLLDALRAANASPSSTLDEMSGERKHNLSSSGKDAPLMASEVDDNARHFPPCMHQTLRRLRTERHLKYDGRQQFGVFLKGLRMPLEESLVFWRRAFAPRVSDDAFSKQYSYNIRHHYGQEGKRVSAGPQPCTRVIGSTLPNADESSMQHGCPFKAFSAERLAKFIRDYSKACGVAEANSILNSEDSPELHQVLSLAGSKQYQLACTRLFELTHALTSNAAVETVTHPHLFFEASRHFASLNSATSMDIEDLK